MANQKLGKAGFESPDTRPCFYKIIWFANTVDLRIPPDFKHHLPEEAEKATLKTSSGSWDIKVVRKKGEVYLDQGWRDFLKHHSLSRGEFLVFKYNGGMSFEVVIFDKNMITRNTPPPPPPPYPVRTPRQERSFSFNSSRPFFTHVIKKYNIGTTSILMVPKFFQRNNLPLSTRSVILRDPNGICWPVHINLFNAKFIGMCRGWKAFADNNSIELGDVCVFELVEQDTMQVQIFRHN